MSTSSAGLGWKFLSVLVTLFVVALIIIGTMLTAGISNVEKFKALGAWGDFFGGTLNPILTFLTFGGVLVTIALQKIELSMSRDEMRRSANALETQVRYVEKQNFEATFFQMLSLHNTIVNSIDLVNPQTSTNTLGRDCFRVFYTRLNKIYRKKQERAGPGAKDEEILTAAYKVFWRDAQLDLGHYYRYLYNIIRFVKHSPYSDSYYIKLIRAQLSDQELLLLYYNCLSEQGAKFKLLAEEFALFDNMPAVRLLEPGHSKRISASAFRSGR